MPYRTTYGYTSGSGTEMGFMSSGGGSADATFAAATGIATAQDQQQAAWDQQVTSTYVIYITVPASQAEAISVPLNPPPPDFPVQPGYSYELEGTAVHFDDGSTMFVAGGSYENIYGDSVNLEVAGISDPQNPSGQLEETLVYAFGDNMPPTWFGQDVLDQQGDETIVLTQIGAGSTQAGSLVFISPDGSIRVYGWRGKGP